MTGLANSAATGRFWFWAYLFVLSLVAVILTVSDKLRARRGGWRVPENTLLLVAALGGSAVMLLTMLLIRHKTRHPRFMLGIPLMLVLQIPAAVWILTRWLA